MSTDGCVVMAGCSFDNIVLPYRTTSSGEGCVGGGMVASAASCTFTRPRHDCAIATCSSGAWSTTDPSCVLACGFYVSGSCNASGSGSEVSEVHDDYNFTIGRCATSPNYPSKYGVNQACEIQVSRPACTVSVQAFNTAPGDTLTMGNVTFNGYGIASANGLNGMVMYASMVLQWQSVGVPTATGWELCSQPGDMHHSSLNLFVPNLHVAIVVASMQPASAQVPDVTFLPTTSIVFHMPDEHNNIELQMSLACVTVHQAVDATVPPVTQPTPATFAPASTVTLISSKRHPANTASIIVIIHSSEL